MKTLLVILVTLVSFASWAVGPCHDDMLKLCPDKMGKRQGQAMKCLHDKMDQLSPECHNHVMAAEGRMKNAFKACQSDVEQFCKDIEHGQGRVRDCLKSHINELSPECKAFHHKLKDR